MVHGWTGRRPPRNNQRRTQASAGTPTTFAARAIDHAGNVEAWPADHDAVTTVEALPPQTSVEVLPPYSHSPILVRWSGSDPGGSGIQRYEVQFRVNDGVWTNWSLDTTATSALFSEWAGRECSFRVRGIDNAQNEEAWPVNGADATTMIYTWAVAGNATDNRGAPVAGMTVTTVPAALSAASSDEAGAYAAYVADGADAYVVNWSKAGYGSLPPTALRGGVDAHMDPVLPPADNVVQNWGFESSSDSWQFAGSLTGTITDSVKHSGASAAFLGSKFGPFRSTTTLTNQVKSAVTEFAIDAAGIIHGVWIGLDGHVMYSRKPLTGTWTAPTPLRGPTGDQPRLVVDSGGTVHVLWLSDTAPRGLYYSRRQSEAEWSVPERIPGSDFAVNRPGLAMGAGGVVKVVWTSEESGPSGRIYVQYFSQRDPSGAWTPPRTPSDDDAVPWTINNSTAMIIDNHGTTHVAWIDGNGVYYRQRPAGASWSSTETLVESPGGWSVSMFVDRLERVHLAWDNPWSTGQIRYAVRANGTWSIPVGIAPPGTQASAYEQPTIAVNDDLAVHVLWSEMDQSHPEASLVRHSAKGPYGVWSPPVNVYQGAYSQERPQLLLDGSGKPHALWVSSVGGSGVVLYAEPAPAPTGGEAILSQLVQVPAAALAPTLSFFYRFGTEFSSNSQLEVAVDDGVAPTAVFSTTAGSETWAHQWVDLAPWAAQRVTLRFKVIEAAGGGRAWGYIDEVTVGAAHPDTWVSHSGRRAAPPGAQIDQTVLYGNRGGATASSAYVTLQLPPELAFVSADPPPSVVSPALRWDVGDLAAGSRPGTINVALQVASSAAFGTTLATTAVISSDTAELEQANNTAETTMYVGNQLYLPLIERR